MKYKILFIYSFLCISMFVKGQISEVDKRIVRYEAIMLLDSYNELSKKLETRDQLEEFRKIFEDDAKINNDILGDNNLNESLSIDEYIEKRLENKTRINNYTIRPYRIEVFEADIKDMDENSGIVELYIKKAYKEVVYQEFRYKYKDTIDLKFEISYRFTDNPCTHDKKGRGVLTDISHCSDSILLKIKSIETQREYGKYAFIEIKNKKRLFGYGPKSWKYDENATLKSVEINNSIQLLDEYGVIFIDNITEENKLKISPLSEAYFQTKTIRLKPDNIGSHIGPVRNNKFPIRFRKKSVFIEPNFSFLKKESEFSFTGSQTFLGVINFEGTNYGIDLGFDIFNWKQIPLSLSAYSGYIHSQVTFNAYADSYQQSFSAVDPAGDKYQRTSLIQNITETGSISFDQYSLGLKLSYNLLKEKDRNIGSYFGLGRNFILNANFDYSSQAEASYDGKYGSELFNISIGENGVYDFGNYNLVNSSNVMEQDASFLYNFDFGFYFEYQNRLSFNVGVSYWNNPNNMFTESEYLSSDPTELNSIILKSDASSLKMINFELGIKYYL